MKVRYKDSLKANDFFFKDGDDIRIIVTSFLYATESRPELVYEAKLLEVDEAQQCFWFAFKDNPAREEECLHFAEVECVISVNDEYPNRKDPLIRFALEGLDNDE